MNNWIFINHERIVVSKLTLASSKIEKNLFFQFFSGGMIFIIPFAVV
jgi:hypothetical protein